MKLTDNTGMNLTQATDFTLRELMGLYKISRADARKLLAECLIRNCVQEEITATAEVLLGLNE